VDVDLNEVATFVRVVESGGFSAAAGLLGVPKSTVSRRISRLEDKLAVRLLHRTTRQMRLTEAGRAFFDRVAHPVSLLHEASVATVEESTEPRGVLRVTAPIDFGHAYLDEIVAGFVEQHPEVHVYVELSNRTVDLVQEGFDVALRAGSLDDSSLVARRLGAIELKLFASTTYAETHGLPTRPEELSDHRCVLFRPRNTTKHWRLGTADEEVDVEVRGVVSASDFGFIRRMVQAGLGVGLMPAFFGIRACKAGVMVPVLPEWATKSGALHLLYPTNQHMPAKVKAFRDYLLAALDSFEWST